MEEDKRDLVELSGRTTRRRRSYPLALKRQMVEETLSGDQSVSAVARRYDVNANQLFRWRKLYREGRLGVRSPSGSSGLMPVVVTPQADLTEPGAFEIDLGNGRRVTLRGDVDARVLRTVLEVLR